MFSKPHLCPVSDVPLAAKTITSVMIKANPLTKFVYNKHQAPPLLPRGKLEIFTIWLYQLRTNGIVLTVDDENEKCIGVAVWTGPMRHQSFFGKLRAWCILFGLNIWLRFGFLYYGSEQNETVRRDVFKLLNF